MNKSAIQRILEAIEKGEMKAALEMLAPATEESGHRFQEPIMVTQDCSSTLVQKMVFTKPAFYNLF